MVSGFHPDELSRQEQLAGSYAYSCMLDMDGVVADFVEASLSLHGVPYPYDNLKGDEAWDLMKHIGMSHEDFWRPLGYDFWSSIPKTPEADRIVDILVGFLGEEHVCFLTSPCNTDGCMDGKRAWAHKHYPNIPVLFSVRSGNSSPPPKQFCASSRSILVDDHTLNVNNFRQQGGKAFLVPRPWNKDWAQETNLVANLHEFFELCL